MGILERPEHDKVVDQIITDLMSPEILKSFSKEQLEAIRACVSFARDDGITSIGDIMAKHPNFGKKHRVGYPTPITPLDEEMAKKAIEFEKQQAPKFLARVDNANYPWRWCYASTDVQNQFRDFCTKES